MLYGVKKKKKNPSVLFYSTFEEEYTRGQVCIHYMIVKKKKANERETASS